jgi:hypothetical protein
MNAFREGMDDGTGSITDGNPVYRQFLKSRPEVQQQLREIEEQIPLYVPNRQKIIDDMTQQLLRSVEQEQLKVGARDISVVSGIMDGDARLKMFNDARIERRRHQLGAGVRTNMATQTGEEEKEEEEKEDEDEEEEEKEEDNKYRPISISDDMTSDIRSDIRANQPILYDLISGALFDAYNSSNILKTDPDVTTDTGIFWEELAVHYKSFIKPFTRHPSDIRAIVSNIKILNDEAFGQFSQMTNDVRNRMTNSQLLENVANFTGISVDVLQFLQRNFRTKTSGDNMITYLYNSNVTKKTASTKKKIKPVNRNLAYNVWVTVYANALTLGSGKIADSSSFSPRGTLLLPKTAFTDADDATSGVGDSFVTPAGANRPVRRFVGGLNTPRNIRFGAGGAGAGAGAGAGSGTV